MIDAVEEPNIDGGKNLNRENVSGENESVQ
jgi:hypothetical protein